MTEHDSNRSSRKGDWIQTFTGHQFWPLDPRPREIHLEDIAHALAMICRYNGHVVRFYSVAEHCCLLVDYVLTTPTIVDEDFRHRVARLILMHDAAEAYLADVARPLKAHLTGFSEIEDRLLKVILDRFEIDQSEDPWTVVKFLDTRILLDERAALLKRTVNVWGIEALKPLGVHIESLPPPEAKTLFLDTAAKLGIA